MSEKLRIVPLGGCGEIGKNMTVIEYGDEILIIDAGIMFPENDMLGIDAIIPDYNYLADKMHKVKGVLITHGHEDHVGAIGYLMADVDAPIYATTLTAGLVEVKLQRANLLSKVKVHVIDAEGQFEVGSFLIEPFHVAHSIPDCVGFGITTPVGLIVHTGDYKFDHTPVDGWPPDFARLAEFSRRGVLCLLGDSTNAERAGWTASEAVITEAFEELFRNNQRGRIIVASFASLISRIQQVADASVRYGRKLAITGRSMRDNTKMARRLGYLNIPDDLLIDISQAQNYAPHQVTIMATGSQGEPGAVLGQLAYNRHRSLKIQEGDTVVISAHAIPGNEEGIHRIINRLMQRGAEVLYEGVAKVHVSGHASREEMKLMINLVQPQFIMPVHGELRHLRAHGKLAVDLGIPEDNIAVVENGNIVEFTSNSMEIGPRLPGGYIFVDGASVGEVGWSVMRDREKLAENGFFVVSFFLNTQGHLVGKPELLSRGFTDLRKAPDLVEGVQESVRRMVALHGSNMSKSNLEKRLRDELRRYLYDETGRRPLIQIMILGTA
ncbi:MAG TPA: ribonuclease J [Anaerolineae bacterium]|nr:ribonuclease J [Anaerolineae bacterium]